MSADIGHGRATETSQAVGHGGRRRLNLAAANRLAELATFAVPFAVRAAAELGVADHLGDAPDVERISERLGCHARSVLRLLRTLATVGLVEEPSEGRFVLTADGELLRSDHPYSVRDSCRLVPSEIDALALLDRSIRGEGAAFELEHGSSFWAYLDGHEEASRAFDRSQDAVARLQGAAVARLLDSSGVRRIVDVGGGRGAFLRALLRGAKQASGVCFDRPVVIDSAGAGAEAIDGRLTFVGGDFFADVPGGADVYVLNRVLYGWDDERAAALLRVVRNAMPDGGRLLVMEPLAGESDPVFDLLMLALSAGRTRRADELEQLLQRGGFTLVSRTPAMPFPVLVADAAPR